MSGQFPSICRLAAEQLRDESGPAGLVARADAALGVAVEVFVEEDVVFEVRVGGELGMITLENWGLGAG